MHRRVAAVEVTVVTDEMTKVTVDVVTGWLVV